MLLGCSSRKDAGLRFLHALWLLHHLSYKIKGWGKKKNRNEMPGITPKDPGCEKHLKATQESSTSGEAELQGGARVQQAKP